MALRLVVVGGPAVGAQLALVDQPVFQIGRSPAADLTLHDPSIAEFHLKLKREVGGARCVDASGVGFTHNGRKALDAQLKVGDAIALGSHSLRLLSDAVHDLPTANVPSPVQGAALLALKGNDAGRSFPISHKNVIILGRGASTDITIWDVRASRAHARIDRMGDAYRISDLNSSNGTEVNGQKITTHDLSEGDVVTIGSTVMRFSAANGG